MMQKYVLVEGIAGYLSEDPRAPAANPRRYLGMSRVAGAETIAEHANRYAPTPVVVLAEVARDALSQGAVTLLGTCVAESTAKATEKLSLLEKDGN